MGINVSDTNQPFIIPCPQLIEKTLLFFCKMKCVKGSQKCAFIFFRKWVTQKPWKTRPMYINMNFSLHFQVISSSNVYHYNKKYHWHLIICIPSDWQVVITFHKVPCYFVKWLKILVKWRDKNFITSSACIILGTSWSY